MAILGPKSLVLPMFQNDGRQLFQYIIRGRPLRRKIKNSVQNCKKWKYNLERINDTMFSIINWVSNALWYIMNQSQASRSLFRLVDNGHKSDKWS